MARTYGQMITSGDWFGDVHDPRSKDIRYHRLEGGLDELHVQLFHERLTMKDYVVAYIESYNTGEDTERPRRSLFAVICVDENPDVVARNLQIYANTAGLRREAYRWFLQDFDDARSGAWKRLGF